LHLRVRHPPNLPRLGGHLLSLTPPELGPINFSPPFSAPNLVSLSTDVPFPPGANLLRLVVETCHGMVFHAVGVRTLIRHHILPPLFSRHSSLLRLLPGSFSSGPTSTSFVRLLCKTVVGLRYVTRSDYYLCLEFILRLDIKCLHFFAPTQLPSPPLFASNRVLLPFVMSPPEVACYT